MATARKVPLEVNPEQAIIKCGRRTKEGRWTCGGAFAEFLEVPHRPAQLWIYAIYREIRPGVYDLNDHAKKQRAAGREISLRRHRLRDNDRRAAGRAPARDLGKAGEQGGISIEHGPVTVLCPRCREPNTIPASWLER